MQRVDRFTNLLAAVQAADHLIANGVIARVVGDRRALDFNLLGAATYDVLVLDKTQADRARELIASMTPIAEEEIDWDAALAPDLTRLDPALAPACPHCAETLPMDSRLEQCPQCHGDVDVPALIADDHGPEALAPCYEGEPMPIDERMLPAARLHCPRCHYSLEGLAISGNCPECGRTYDKRDIVRSMIE